LVSTLFTMIVKGCWTCSGKGEPVLPAGVPGEAISPGTSTCSRLNPPGVTVVIEPTLVFERSLMSRALIVCWPAVLNVIEKLVLLPVAPRAVFCGSAALWGS
jgi:hypothetical protein